VQRPNKNLRRINHSRRRFLLRAQFFRLSVPLYLPREYGFTGLDGSRPHWGNYARKKYGRYKIRNEKFYSYWVPA